MYISAVWGALSIHRGVLFQLTKHLHVKGPVAVYAFQLLNTWRKRSVPHLLEGVRGKPSQLLPLPCPTPLPPLPHPARGSSLAILRGRGCPVECRQRLQRDRVDPQRTQSPLPEDLYHETEGPQETEKQFGRNRTVQKSKKHNKNKETPEVRTWHVLQ